ncbi:MAG: lipoyl(octanoyl) transferase LipB [Firmicutes bacterium]|nr:lipoyl(octanoyl) transferase LipB [Bacillota bacterium]
MTFDWVDLGLVEYDQAFRFQELVHQERCSGTIPDTVIIQVNPPVITIGRSGSRGNLKVSEEALVRAGVRVLHVSRGGDVTYHGPGQLVISPVLGLKDLGVNLRRYVYGLEQVVISLLSLYGIDAGRIDGLPGVWVGNRKIAALGIAVRRGVTLHGVSLNVQPDLRHFDWITPCGLEGYGVTSMAACLGRPLDEQQLKSEFLREFGVEFGADTSYGSSPGAWWSSWTSNGKSS